MDETTKSRFLKRKIQVVAGLSRKKIPIVRLERVKIPEAPKLPPLPVEVLAKIFNYLPNHDIRCRISLACKFFYKICQDESLVPVKDLCIYGHPVGRKSKKEGQEGKRHYSLSGEEAVFDTIIQSKNLTSLKIKALSTETVNELVLTALHSCPKLTSLEIIDSPKQLGEYF